MTAARLPDRPLRVVVVGAGSGGRLSIAAAADSADYDLVGIADRSAPAASGAAADLAPGTATFPDLEQPLRVLDPDVVCVSTWAPSHRELTQQALEARVRGLLVEKPIAGTLTDARAVLAAIEHDRIPVVVPHGLMSMPAPLQLLDRLRDGSIGRLRDVEIDCTGWDLINAGIHWLQFAIACLGDDRVTTVRCTADIGTRTYRDGFMVETSAVTSAETEAGVRLRIRTGDDIEVASPTGSRIAFRGDVGSAAYEPWQHEYRIDSGRGAETVACPPGDQPTGHRFYLQRLHEQITGSEADYTIPRQSLLALEIIRAAYRSARTGETVRLPLADDLAPAGADDAWIPGEIHDPRRGGRNGRALPPPAPGTPRNAPTPSPGGPS